MDINMCACIHDTPNKEPACLKVDSGSVEFSCPPQLREAGFPHSDVQFAFDNVRSNPSSPDMHKQFLQEVSAKLLQRESTVIFSAGPRATPKRQLLFGTPDSPESGCVWKTLESLYKQPGFSNNTYKVMCFALGNSESVADMLDLENVEGIVRDSLKGPPKVSNVTELDAGNWEEMKKALATIAKNYTQYFKDVLELDRENPFPTYNGENMMFSLKLFPPEIQETAAEEDLDEMGQIHKSTVEQCSIQFIALGDSDRPPLCGIDTSIVKRYEEQQRTLSSVIGVLGAIRCKRLRIPFGKCRLTHILKRVYNAEKNNAFSEENKPTNTIFFFHTFNGETHAEEIFHGLSFAKKIVNVISGSGSRDLALEKWRLEQDIEELKDELEIAKAVHGYKPAIYGQAKPVQNIKEEEQKRVNKILEQREKQKAEALEQMRQQAQEEARQYIEAEQKKTSHNLKALEAELETKKKQNATLNADRDAKIKEYDKQLERIRKKKQEEEEKTKKLKKEIAEIQDLLEEKREQVAKQRQQLDMLSKDHTQGKDMILQNREEAQKKREKLEHERSEQRKQWLKQIEETNAKVLEQVAEVEALRKNRAATMKIADKSEEDDGIESVRQDINTMVKYLPKLLCMDSSQQDEKTENVRKQLEGFFDTERLRYEEKLQEEKHRREQLDKAAEQYRNKINEQQSKVKRNQFLEANKKEKHLDSLIEQVIQYLEHGCRMTKITTGKGVARKKFYYISDDRRRMMSCDLDEWGAPVNRKRPTSTTHFRDIRRIILGQYTPTFQAFAKDTCSPHAVLHDEEGAYNPSSTPNVTPSNVGSYFYRSFSFEFHKGKTLDLVTDTDNDFEAWIVGLKRLLGSKDDWEKMQDKKATFTSDAPPQIVWGEPLKMTNKPGSERLMAEEAALCEENHITPMQYIHAKSQIIKKSQDSFVTVYDVRTLSSLDLLRSKVVYNFFIDKKLIPAPTWSQIV